VIVYGTLNIHRLAPNNVPPGPGSRPGPAQEASPDPGGLVRKVLVVDDEADLAELAEALLGSCGLEVVVANSAMEALQLLAQDGDIDAVFSDVMMPGMNGLQLADAVSEFYPRVKIVLTSGYTVPALLEDRQRRYLFTPKPYRLETIMQLLRS
jgi:two-component system OmpR family response regulator